MNSDDILNAAKLRGKQLGLPYAGALTPSEAYDLMQQNAAAKLVDVRTRAEWDWVGRVPGAVEIEVMSYPGNRPNQAFIEELEKKSAEGRCRDVLVPQWWTLAQCSRVRYTGGIR